MKGNRIKELRERKHWTQVRLATEAGLDKSFIHNLETGKRQTCSAERAQRLATALGVLVEDLVDTATEVSFSLTRDQTLEELVESIKEKLPVTVPLYDQNCAPKTEQCEYTYLTRDAIGDNKAIALRTCTNEFAPHVKQGDIVIANCGLKPKKDDLVIYVDDDGCLRLHRANMVQSSQIQGTVILCMSRLREQWTG